MCPLRSCATIECRWPISGSNVRGRTLIELATALAADEPARETTPWSDAAAMAGFSDQPHLHREVRDLTAMSLATLRQDSWQNRSIDVPSGSVTVA